MIDRETYYRKGVFRHFTEDCKCSVSMTARIDVTELKAYSDKTGTKFYLNFLYLLSKVLNSREDYRMGYFYQTDELVCYDVIHPMQYVFSEDTETCTPVYSEYDADYPTFYRNALKDMEQAKQGQPSELHNRTGLTRPTSRGSATTRCTSSCRTAICTLRRSSTGAGTAKKTDGS